MCRTFLIEQSSPEPLSASILQKLCLNVDVSAGERVLDGSMYSAGEEQVCSHETLPFHKRSELHNLAMRDTSSRRRPRFHIRSASIAVRQEQAEPRGIHSVQADLSTWTVLPDACDVVIANMVLMDIPDYLPALRACIASLKSGGSLIISLLHPCFEEPGSEWKDKASVEVREYFQEQVIRQAVAPFIHRPLSTYLNSIIEEGCTLQKVIEPQLDEALTQQYQAQRYSHVPGYLVIHALRSS